MPACPAPQLEQTRLSGVLRGIFQPREDCVAESQIIAAQHRSCAIRPYGVPGWPSMQILCSRHPVLARGTHNAVQRAHAASFASTKRMTANQTEQFVMPKTTSSDANTATTALLTVTRPADLK